MIELVFLGTGSAIPTKRRNTSAIWLRYEGESFLWDCGEGTQKQLMTAKLNFMKISRIFITHWHADHWAGLLGLMQTMSLEKRKQPLYIYGPEAERFVGDLLDLDYWGPSFKVIPKKVPYEGKDETVIYETPQFYISSTPVNHTVPAVGYAIKVKDVWNVDIKKANKYGLKQGPLVGKLKEKGEIEFKGKTITMKDVGVMKRGEKLVYSGDTRKCDALISLAKDADVLIHDSTFLENREDRMHTGVKEAVEAAKKSNSKMLVLTHFSRRYTDLKPLEKEAKSLFKNTRIAEDFMRMKIKGHED
ncbi:MAG: ribonuclease Z [Candidatus Aenigmatarchaeota archaeon]|nr:ribonuclease Z [Nanoarchaeota archaeon]